MLLVEVLCSLTVRVSSMEICILEAVVTFQMLEQIAISTEWFRTSAAWNVARDAIINIRVLVVWVWRKWDVRLSFWVQPHHDDFGWNRLGIFQEQGGMSGELPLWRPFAIVTSHWSMSVSSDRVFGLLTCCRH